MSEEFARKMDAIVSLSRELWDFWWWFYYLLRGFQHEERELLYVTLPFPQLPRHPAASQLSFKFYCGCALDGPARELLEEFVRLEEGEADLHLEEVDHAVLSVHHLRVNAVFLSVVLNGRRRGSSPCSVTLEVALTKDVWAANVLIAAIIYHLLSERGMDIFTPLEEAYGRPGLFDELRSLLRTTYSFIGESQRGRRE
ncbi:MAG: hypothetical protein QW230_02545 [Thermofilum sp.]